MPHLVYGLENGNWSPMRVAEGPPPHLLGLTGLHYEPVRWEGNVGIIEEFCNGFFRVLFIDSNAVQYRYNSNIPHFYELGELIPYNGNPGSNVLVQQGWLHAQNSPAFPIALSMWRSIVEQRRIELVSYKLSQAQQKAQYEETLRLQKEQEIAELKKQLAVQQEFIAQKTPVVEKIVIEEKPEETKADIEETKVSFDEPEAGIEEAEESTEETKVRNEATQVKAAEPKKEILPPAKDPKLVRQEKLDRLINSFPKQIDGFCKLYQDTDALPFSVCEGLLLSKEKCVTKALKESLLRKLLAYGDEELKACKVPHRFVNIAAEVCSNKELRVAIVKKFSPVQAPKREKIKSISQSQKPLKPKQKFDKAIAENNANDLKALLQDNQSQFLIPSLELLATDLVLSPALKKIILQQVLKLDVEQYYELNDTYNFAAIADTIGMSRQVSEKNHPTNIWAESKALEVHAYLSNPNIVAPIPAEHILLFANKPSPTGRTVLMQCIAAEFPVDLLLKVIMRSGESILARDNCKHNVFHFLVRYLRSEYIPLVDPLCNKFAEAAKHKQRDLAEELNTREISKGNTYVHALLESDDLNLALDFFAALYVPKREQAFSLILFTKNVSDNSIASLLDKKDPSWRSVRKLLYSQVEATAFAHSKRCQENSTEDLYFPRNSCFFYSYGMDEVFYLLEDKKIADAMEILDARYQLQKALTAQYDKALSRLKGKAKNDYEELHEKLILYFKRGGLATMRYNVTQYTLFAQYFLENPNNPLENIFVSSEYFKELDKKLEAPNRLLWAQALNDFSNLKSNDTETKHLKALITLLKSDVQLINSAVLWIMKNNNLSLLKFLHSRVGFVTSQQTLMIALHYAPENDFELFEYMCDTLRINDSLDADQFKILSNALYLQSVKANRSVSKTLWLIQHGFDVTAPSPTPEDNLKNILQELLEYFCEVQEKMQEFSLQQLYYLLEVLFYKPEDAKNLLANVHGTPPLAMVVRASYLLSEVDNAALNNIFKIMLDSGAKLEEFETTEGYTVLNYVLSRNNLEFLELVLNYIPAAKLQPMLNQVAGEEKLNIVEIASAKSVAGKLDVRILQRLEQLHSNPPRPRNGSF